MNIHNQILKEIFKCDKCFNVMMDPVSTRCGHKFCIKCICINKTEFGCSVCKIYLNQGDFFSNSEMKNSIDKNNILNIYTNTNSKQTDI